MFKNYFLIAFRSFKKDKVDTLISLSSLIIGLVAVILIAGYINYSTRFEQSYSNHNQVYRLISNDDRHDYGNTEDVPSGFGSNIVNEIPEVKDQTNIDTRKEQVLIKNQYSDIIVSGVNSSFFSIFNLKFEQGNPKTALSNSNSIVLTVSAAKRLFNTTQVVGQSFNTKDDAYIISGIAEDMPQNSFLQTEAFYYRRPKPALTKSDLEGGYNGGNDFIFLNRDASVAAVTQKINQLSGKLGLNHLKISLQPISDMHLYSSNIKGQDTHYNLGDIKYVYIYGCIALLLLLIGCINFINLTIARNMERTMEMGIRKVMGAQKKQIILQILVETGAYFFAAAVIAFILAIATWKQFTLLSDIQAGIYFMLDKLTITAVIAVCIIACLVSGLYPALFLSKIYPVVAIKKGYQNPGLNFNFRKILITAQLTISVVLIIATIIVRSQLNYLNNKPLGFNKYNLVSFKLPFSNNYPEAFKNELLQNPNIEAVSLSSTDIGNTYSMTTALNNPVDSFNLLPTVIIVADMDFMKTFQIPILQGRGFSRNHPADMVDYDSANWTGADPNRPIIVTNALVNALQMKDPVGKMLTKDFFLQGTIIGVSGDFNGTSFKTQAPLICIRNKASGAALNHAYTRISAANTASGISFISNIYKKYFPREKFDFSFIDETIAAQYATELRLTQLINIFTGLAIVLLSAGLFSLVSLVVRKRTKEIGIRKILGASVSTITVLIGKEFLWLIIISFIVGAPLSYWAMTKWLQGYAYRTDIQGWFFVCSAGVILFIALLSVGIRAIYAATANPVKSLRTE
ncbi:MAG: ABC transporter permease [Chitinophagaceae bacterium]|nr:ABC transporter permease [Chitinophagaceae bacterium]